MFACELLTQFRKNTQDKRENLNRFLGLQKQQRTKMRKFQMLQKETILIALIEEWRRFLALNYRIRILSLCTYNCYYWLWGNLTTVRKFISIAVYEETNNKYFGEKLQVMVVKQWAISTQCELWNYSIFRKQPLICIKATNQVRARNLNAPIHTNTSRW